MFKKRFWLLCLLSFAQLHSDSPPFPGEGFEPWLTGPLLTPSGNVVPGGTYNVEPYYFALNTTRLYNGHWQPKPVSSLWQHNIQVPIQIGLTKRSDFYLQPQLFYNERNHTHSFHWGDLFIGFDYQLYSGSAKLNHWFPSVKISVKEQIPCGKYQHLNPNKRRADATGGGSYQTSISLGLSHLAYFEKRHYLSTRFSFSYNIPAPAFVHGFNTYGGDKTTRGKVHLGTSYNALLGLEFSLNHNWVLANDISIYWGNKSTFSGKTIAPVGFSSFAQFSLAPAIEYNFNQNEGIIAGVWFTVAGRNISQFTSFVIAYNIYGTFK